MIRSFTDRKPGASALLILAAMFVLPVILMFAEDMFFPGTSVITKAIFVYAILAQLILFLNVERPILFMLPFMAGVIGLCVAEMIYTVSMGANDPGAGPSFSIALLSTYMVSVCGANASAFVGGVILLLPAKGIRALYEKWKYRKCK